MLTLAIKWGRLFTRLNGGEIFLDGMFEIWQSSFEELSGDKVPIGKVQKLH